MDMDLNIRLADNGGVILKYDDPKVRESNREEDSKFEDPTVELVFKDMKEAMPEVQRVLRKLSGDETSDDEFSSAFDEAASDE